MLGIHRDLCLQGSCAHQRGIWQRPLQDHSSRDPFRPRGRRGSVGGNFKFPLFEGATLVVVGTGTDTVGLLDGQAGTTFISGYSNFYQLPATVSGTSQVLLDNFGYDGQIGTSRTISLSNETTNAEGWPSFTNNILVAGPGGETGDSDWDGSSGWPLPQLWDDTGHDITNAFVAGDYWVLVSYNSVNDCIGTVGAVVSVSP
jgi:hypothetical protein